MTWRGNDGCTGGGSGTAILWGQRMYATNGHFVLDKATGREVGSFAGMPAFNGSRGFFVVGT